MIAWQETIKFEKNLPMNIFRRLFGKPANPAANFVECPRCLGKGHVDESDIIRLKQELRWKPGACAFCNGSGKVDPNNVDKVAANESYLTNNLSVQERKRLFKRDKLALEQMRRHNAFFDALIQQMRKMHFEQGLNAEQITDWMIANYPSVLDGKRISESRPEVLAYIEKVINHKE
jgi:hypothetical protein